MAVNIFDPKPAAPEAPTSSSDIFAGTPLAGVSQSSNRAATPEQIRRWVEQYARQYGVPLDLALRLVNQESGFRSNAVSSAGAIGPAQLMPATARELGVNPRDPEANVRAGMDYLAQKYREFGNWQEALAAYNAGSGAVRSGRALSIPETANYVRSILSGTAFASRPAEASARPGGVDIFAPPTTAPTLTIPGGADIFAPGAAQPATSATKPAVQEHEGVLQYGMDLLHGIERGLTLGFIRPEDAKTQAGRIVEGIGNMIGQTPAVILAMMATEGLAAPMLLRVGLAGAMVGTGEAGVGSAVHGEPVSRIPGAAVSSGASFMAGEGILRLFAPIIRAIASKLGRSAESVAEDVARQARQTGQTPQQILDRINRGADQLSLFDEGARQGLVEQAAERRTPSPASLIRGLAGTGLESQPVGIVAPGFKAANELTDAVQQFVRNTLTPEPAAGSIEDRLYTLGTRSQEAEIRARHLLESIQGTMREADPENVLIHYDENHSIPLTPEQRQVYDTVIRPLKDATAQIFARLRGLDPNTLPDEFTNHYVQERGNLVDRALSGARRGFSLGGRLSTAASFLKGRTMKAIEDDQGHRYVVAIKDGRVTAFANGVREDLGAFKFRTLDELKAQELAPIQRRIGKLSQDIRALSSVKTLNLPQRVTQLESEIDSLTSGLAGAADEAGVPLDARIQAQKRDLAAAVRELKTLQGPARNVTRLQGRLNTLAQKVEDLKAIALEIGTRYDPASAKQRVFVPSKGSLAGRRFTVRDATIKEIESNTDLRYHKDILATRLLTYLKAVRVNNNLEFLETLKTDPQFASIGRKIDPSAVLPETRGLFGRVESWRPSQIPQLRGFVFDPRVADSLDRWYGKYRMGEGALDGEGFLGGLNRILRTAIFFNPLIHIPNVGGHWFMNRGLSRWVAPSAWKTLGETGARAFEALRTQNDDYLRLLHAGAPLMANEFRGEALQKLLLDKMGSDLKANPLLLMRVAKVLHLDGPMGPLSLIYDLSHKATWQVNDLLTMQAIFEEERAGYTLEEAIRRVGRHIPDYRVPARILNSGPLSAALTNPNLTMFGAYHYGLLKNWGQIGKELIDRSLPPSERFAALDKLAAFGFMMALYPTMDTLARHLTGDQKTYVRRFGPTSIAQGIWDLTRQQRQWTSLLTSIITPAPASLAAAQAFFNRDIFTGKNVYDPYAKPGAIAKGVGTEFLKSFAPQRFVSQFTQSPAKALETLAGITTPKSTPAETRLHYLTFEKKDQVRLQMNVAAARGDTKTATDLMNEYNRELDDVLSQVYRENGKRLSPRAARELHLRYPTLTSVVKWERGHPQR